jgi:hypothetical protein
MNELHKIRTSNLVTDFLASETSEIPLPEGGKQGPFMPQAPITRSATRAVRGRNKWPSAATLETLSNADFPTKMINSRTFFLKYFK